METHLYTLPNNGKQFNTLKELSIFLGISYSAARQLVKNDIVKKTIVTAEEQNQNQIDYENNKQKT